MRIAHHEQEYWVRGNVYPPKSRSGCEYDTPEMWHLCARFDDEFVPWAKKQLSAGKQNRTIAAFWKSPDGKALAEELVRDTGRTPKGVMLAINSGFESAGISGMASDRWRWRRIFHEIGLISGVMVDALDGDAPVSYRRTNLI